MDAAFLIFSPLEADRLPLIRTALQGPIFHDFQRRSMTSRVSLVMTENGQSACANRSVATAMNSTLLIYISNRDHGRDMARILYWEGGDAPEQFYVLNRLLRPWEGGVVDETSQAPHFRRPIECQSSTMYKCVDVSFQQNKKLLLNDTNLILPVHFCDLVLRKLEKNNRNFLMLFLVMLFCFSN